MPYFVHEDLKKVSHFVFALHHVSKPYLLGRKARLQMVDALNNFGGAAPVDVVGLVYAGTLVVPNVVEAEGKHALLVVENVPGGVQLANAERLAS